MLLTIARADEGMWQPYFINGQNCKLTAEQIFSFNYPSRKDAIVQFGNGCTGELISSEEVVTTWQEARPINAPGLSNAYQVSPMLYRGAQPTPEGYKSLAEMGIKAVISFRRTEKPDTKLLNELGLVSYHIPINTFRFKDKHACTFLKIISEQEGPIYIHCYHGSDRTGTMTVLYRIVFEGWTREQALAEMQDKKFGFHKIFSNLIKYIKTVNLDNIKPEQLSALVKNVGDKSGGDFTNFVDKAFTKSILVDENKLNVWLENPKSLTKDPIFALMYDI